MQSNFLLIPGSSKAASTISSNLNKKRPAADSGTTDAKKMHLENSASTSAENVTSSKDGV